MECLKQAAEKCNKTRKGFLQGLKPVQSMQFTSALKHRPPEEKCDKTRKRLPSEVLRSQDKLKAVESMQFTSAPFEARDELKCRPPEEKDFFRDLLECSVVVMGRLWQVVIVIRHFPRET
jgi:hypothetical protein